MNLPAHDLVKHLLVQVHISTHQNEIKKNILPYTRYTLKLVLGIPMLPQTYPLVVQLTSLLARSPTLRIFPP